MKFQIASDLHLEFYDEATEDLFTTLVTPTGAEILLLAGDIGYPEQEITSRFLEWCSKSWTYVFWIYGNHEFYCLGKRITMEEKIKLGYEITSKLPNVKLLDETSFDIPDTNLTVMGATMWTTLTPQNKQVVKHYMNDFRKIYTKDGVFTPNDWEGLNSLHLEYLYMKLEALRGKGRKAIVMTHHLPSYTMVHDKYKGHPMNCGFAMEADHLVKHEAVALWVCGHSHGSKRVGKCILNACGYPGEDVIGYDTKLVVEI